MFVYIVIITRRKTGMFVKIHFAYDSQDKAESVANILNVDNNDHEAIVASSLVG